MDQKKDKILKLINPFLQVADQCFLIEQVYVFGSYAKERENEESDIDLAIVSADFMLLDDTVAMMILFRIASFQNIKIEPVVLVPADLENPTLGSMGWELIKHGIRLR